MLADKGHTREQIKQYDIAWIAEILFPERDEKTGQPKFLTAETSKAVLNPHKAKVDAIIEALRLRGVQIHEMEEKVKEVFVAQQALMKEAGLV